MCEIWSSRSVKHNPKKSNFYVFQLFFFVQLLYFTELESHHSISSFLTVVWRNKKCIKVCPNRIDTRFLLIISKDVCFRKLSWKKSCYSSLDLTRFCETQLGNVFLFVQIYSIYTDFHQQTTKNRVQVNIPNESKTFMGKTIHTLGLPMFMNACHAL